MKNRATYLFILFFFFLSYGYGVVTIHYKIFPFELMQFIRNVVEPVDRSPNYLHRKSFFEEFGQDKYEIVFVGDSLTENAEWEDVFPAFKIANRGVGGDTSDGVLERIDSILSTNANKAFIMVGINDFSKGRSVDFVFENYKKIIKKMRASDIKVYILSTVLGGPRVATLNNSINLLNSKLQAFASEKEGLIYINLNRLLARNGLLLPNFSEDGVHLNAQGYLAWKESIKNYL